MLGRAENWQLARLLGHLLALRARLGQAYGDRLLTARHLLAASPALEGAAFLLVHRPLDVLRCRLRIFSCHMMN